MTRPASGEFRDPQKELVGEEENLMIPMNIIDITMNTDELRNEGHEAEVRTETKLDKHKLRVVHRVHIALSRMKTGTIMTRGIAHQHLATLITLLVMHARAVLEGIEA